MEADRHRIGASGKSGLWLVHGEDVRRTMLCRIGHDRKVRSCVHVVVAPIDPHRPCLEGVSARRHAGHLKVASHGRVHRVVDHLHRRRGSVGRRDRSVAVAYDGEMLACPGAGRVDEEALVGRKLVGASARCRDAPRCAWADQLQAQALPLGLEHAARERGLSGRCHRRRGAVHVVGERPTCFRAPHYKHLSRCRPCANIRLRVRVGRHEQEGDEPKHPEGMGEDGRRWTQVARLMQRVVTMSALTRRLRTRHHWPPDVAAGQRWHA